MSPEPIDLFVAYDGPAWGRPNALADALFCPCEAHRGHAPEAIDWLKRRARLHRATADAIRLVLAGAVAPPRDLRGMDPASMRRELDAQAGLGDSYAEWLGRWEAVAA